MILPFPAQEHGGKTAKRHDHQSDQGHSAAAHRSGATHRGSLRHPRLRRVVSPRHVLGLGLPHGEWRRARPFGHPWAGQGRYEVLELRISLDPELRSNQLLIVARVLDRARPVTCVFQRLYDRRRDAGGERVCHGQGPPSGDRGTVIALGSRLPGHSLERCAVLLLELQSLRLDPAIQVAAVGEVESVEERSTIRSDRIRPLLVVHRLREGANVGIDHRPIEVKLPACRGDRIDPQRAARRVDQLIESVRRTLSRAFGPEVRLNPVTR